MNKHHIFNNQKSNLNKSKKAKNYFIVGTLATLLAACGQKAQTPDEILYDKLIDLATNANITVTDGNATVVLSDAGGTVVIADGDNVVTGGKGADKVTTGSGKDVVDTGAGDDVIITGDGVDIVRAGAGADNVNTGAGKDVIVVIGINENGNAYTQSAIDNAATNVDLSSLITLADINNFGVVGAVSDVVAGDVIDGDAGGATLIVYGEVDMTGVDLSNISVIEVHSKLILTVEQLKGLVASGKFEEIIGDDTSTIVIQNEANDPDAKVDLSGFDIKNVKKLELGDNIEVKIDQDNIDGLEEIQGNSGAQITVEKEAGSTKQEVDLASLKFSGIDKLELGDNVKATLSKDNLDGLKEIGSQNSTDKIEIKLEAKDGEDDLSLADIKLENVEKLELGKDVKVTLNQGNIDALKEVAAESATDDVEIKLEKTDGESEMDLTGLDIKDVDKLEVGGGVEVTVDKTVLDGLGAIGKETSDEDFSLKVAQDSDAAGDVDLSELEISGVDKLVVEDDVVVVIEQDLVDELEEVSGDGAVQSDTEGETLDLGDGGSIQVATVSSGGVTTYTNVASVIENSTVVDYGTLNGVDPSVIFTISGTDAGSFEFVDGVLNFKSAPDFETNNDYVYNIALNEDGGAITPPHNIIISVTDINEAPVLASTTLETLSVEENASATALATVVATDDDGDAIVYSLSGVDAAFFTIDAATAAVSFIGGQDYEDPADDGGDHVYSVSVVATDAEGASDSRDIEITVTDVNEAPEFASSSAATFIVNENQSAVGTVAAVDPESDTLTYSLTGDDATKFDIDAAGVITFVTAPDFEQPDDVGTNGVYNLTVQVDDSEGHTVDRDVTIATLNINEAPVLASTTLEQLDVAENAGATALTAVLAADADAGDAVVYSLSGADAAFFTIDAATAAVSFIGGQDFETPVDDGGDNVFNATIVATDNGGLTHTRDIEVTVTDENEAPELTSVTDEKVNVAENAGSTALATVVATDVDAGDNIAYTLTGDDASFFTIDAATAAVSFNGNQNFEAAADNDSDNVYSVSVVATDDDGLTHSRNIEVTVTEVNEAPVFASTTLEQLDVAENAGTTALTTVLAVDADAGDAVVYSLSGADAAFFTIDAATAAVSFIGGQDFETPADDGGDNVFNATIVATDNGGLTHTRDIEVTVTDENEAPELTSVTDEKVNVAENAGSTALATVVATDVDAGDNIAYTLTGDDASFFTIDAATAAVSFNGNQNFEAAADNDSDNVYSVSVVATDDDGLTHSRNIEVTVTDINEAPEFAADTALEIDLDEGEDTVATETAIDVDASDNITYSLTGADFALFSVSAAGVISFVDTPDFETAADAGADNVYDLNIVATDVDGLSDTRPVIVTIIDINEAPTFSADEILSKTVSHYQTGTATVATVTATDQDAGDSVAYTLGGVDAALFDISANGEITFKTGQSFDSPTDAGGDNVYNITATATDDDSATDTRDIAITVTDENTAPEFNGSLPSDVSVNENSTAVGTFAATDFDPGDTITYSLLGDDAGLFGITSAGEVTFNNAPDYETDVDTYNIIVNASDGTLAVQHALEITLDNVAETPIVYVSAYAGLPGGAQELSDNGEYQTASAALDNGNSIVTFSSWNNDTEQDHIYAQLLDDNGDKINGAITVTDDNNPDNDHLRSEVTSLSNGGFVVIWSKSDNGAGSYHARVYNADGTENGSEIDILATDLESSANPYVEELPDGNLIFVMNKQTTDANSNDVSSIVAKTYNLSTNSLGAEFVLPNDTYNDNNQAYEGIEDLFVADNGQIIVIFGSDNKASSQALSVTNGVISADGDRVNLSEGPENNGQWIKAVQLDNGNIVASWLVKLDDAENEIHYRIFAADRTPISDVLNLDTANDAFILGPQITAIDGGGFAIVAVTEAIGTGGKLLQIQEFLADGTPVGNSVTINSDKSGSDATLYPTSLSILDGNKLLVSWFGQTGDNHHEGNYQVIDFHDDSSYVHLFGANAISPFPMDAMSTQPDDETLEMTLSDVPLGVSFFNPNNGTSSPIGTYVDDGNGTTQTVTIAGTDITDLHIFNPTGDATFTIAVSVEATDSHGGTATKNFNLNFDVTDFGSAPIITMDEIQNAVENNVLVAEIVFTDVDSADTHTFEILGDDADLFEVVGGNIVFKTAQDTDTMNDHHFRITLKVTDIKGNSDLLEIEVRLADMEEAPAIDDTNLNFSVEEGSTGDIATIEINGNDGGVRFKLSGTDAHLFTIDRYDGELKFAVRPDYDNPMDAGADNVYDLNVIAVKEDTGLFSEEAVQVTVTENASEAAIAAPVLTVPHFELVDGRYVDDANYATDQGYVANDPLVFEEGGKLTTLSDGRIVIVWTEEDVADGSQTEPDTVYFKVLAPDGLTEIVGRTLVSTASGNHQLSPAVVAGTSGDFHVSFHVGNNDDSEIMVSHVAVSGDVYTPGALLALSDVPSADVTQIDEFESNLGLLSNGNYVVTYQTDHEKLFVNIVDSSTGVITNIDVTNAFDSESDLAGESLPSIAVMADGSGFVVAWSRRYENGENDRTKQIVTQKFDNLGNSITGANELGNTDNENADVSITALSGSTYVVTWATRFEDSDGEHEIVLAQIYDSSGQVGNSFTVSDTNDRSFDPEVTKLFGPDAGFLIVWNDSGAMRGQQFADDGTKIGGNFVIARQPEDDGVQQIEVTGLADGGFVITWQDKLNSDNLNNTNGGEDGNVAYQVYKFDATPTLFHHDWQYLPNSVSVDVDDASVDYYEVAILGAPNDLEFDVRNQNNHDGHAHKDHQTGDTWIFDTSDMENLSFRVNNNFEGQVSLTYIVTAIGHDGSSVSSSSIVLNYDIKNINNEPHYHDELGRNNLEIFEGEEILMTEVDGDLVPISRQGYDHDGDGFNITIDQTIKDGHLFAFGSDGEILFKAAPDFENSQAENQDEPEIYKFTLVITDEHGAENRTEYEVRVKDRDDDTLVGATIEGTPPTAHDGFFVSLNLNLGAIEAGTHVNEVVIYNTDGFEFFSGTEFYSTAYPIGDGSWIVPAADLSTLKVKSINNAVGNHDFVFAVSTLSDSGVDGATHIKQTVTVEFQNWDLSPNFENFGTEFHVNPNDTFVANKKVFDADGDSLTYTLTGTDAALFEYDEATGDINFKSGSIPDSSNEGDVYSVVLTATDGDSNTLDAVINLDITVDTQPASLASTYLVNPNHYVDLSTKQLTFDEADNQQQREHTIIYTGSDSGLLIWKQDDSVFAQSYDSSALNTTGSPVALLENVGEPTAASTGVGNVIMAWHEHDGNENGIFAAYVTQGSGGSEIGTKIRINTDISGDSRNVEIEVLQSNTGAAFIWTEGDGLNNDIYARIVFGNVNGPENLTGNVFKVNSHTAGVQTDYKVTALEDDSIIVTWTSYGAQDGSGAGVYMQKFKTNEAGDTIALLNGGDDVQINDRTLGDQDDADVTVLQNGNFVVTWHDTANWGDVKAKLFTPDGTAIDLTYGEGSEPEYFLTASDGPSHIGQSKPTVLGLNNGDFIIVWKQNWHNDDTDTDYEGIVGQRFNSFGSKAGDQFIIDQYERDDDINQWYGDIQLSEAPEQGYVNFSVSWRLNSREDGQDEISHIYSKIFAQSPIVKIEADETIKVPMQTDIPDGYGASIAISGLDASISVYVTHDDGSPATLLSPVSGDYTLTKEEYQHLELVSAPSVSSLSEAVVSVTVTAPNGETALTSDIFILTVGEFSTVDANHEFIDQLNQTDFVTGTDQIDTFIIDGVSSDYSFIYFGADLSVVNSAGTSLDLLHGIEKIAFTDDTFTLEELDILAPVNSQQSSQVLEGDILDAVLGLMDYDPLGLL